MMEPIKYLEVLPKLTQLYRSLRELPDELIGELNNPDLAKVLKSLEIRDELLGNCGVVSQLDINQAKVVITGVMPEVNSITFALTNPHLFHTNPNLLPAGNTSSIRTEVLYYMRNRDRVSLKPHKGTYQGSPDVLDFLVTTYDPTTNLGRAMVSPYQKSLLLGVSEAEVYEFPIGNLLLKVTPIIGDAYLLD